MPSLPLTVNAEPRRRPDPGRRPRPRRRIRILLAGCLLLVAGAACSEPEQNPAAVSLNLRGPVQFNHESLIDRASGVLVESEVTATARLSGSMYPIPQVLWPALPDELVALSEAAYGMDGEWTITQHLESDLPAAGAPAGLLTAGGALLLLGLGAGILIRRRNTNGSTTAPPVSSEEPAPALPEAVKQPGEGPPADVPGPAGD